MLFIFSRKEKQTMKNLTKKLEKLFCAAAFAEEGEFETARELLRENERNQTTDNVSPNIRPRQELRAPGIKR
jgi:hypothetical protein